MPSYPIQLNVLLYSSLDMFLENLPFYKTTRHHIPEDINNYSVSRHGVHAVRIFSLMSFYLLVAVRYSVFCVGSSNSRSQS
jgi:hypothetical protein